MKRVRGWGKALIVRARGSAFYEINADTVDWIVCLICINAARKHNPASGIKEIGNYIKTHQDEWLLRQVTRRVRDANRLRIVDVLKTNEDSDVSEILGSLAPVKDPPPADPQAEKVRERMRAARLTMLERSVLLARYGIDTTQLSLRECAEHFKKSPIQIRKVEVQALKKLGALG